MTAWRIFVILVSAFGMGSNLVLLTQGWRHRDFMVFPTLMFWYPLAAVATCAFFLTYRVIDAAAAEPFNSRDFTVLIPAAGFLLAGYIGTRQLGHRVGVKENAHDLGRPRRRIDD